jgi:fumarate hydratase, class II
MLITALSPVFGYDKCAKLAHYAQENDRSLCEANQKLGFVSDDQFQKVIRPEAMTKAEVVHIQQSKNQASKETLQASS